MKTANYLTLDTETCTLAFVNEMNLTPEQKKKVAIARPLVYDIGWTIANRTKGIIEKRQFLVAETFCVPSVFNTAYYAEKRPRYLEMLEKGETKIMPWNDIVAILLDDLKNVKYICAYNAMFDFKRAISFTELYISKLYSPSYYEWENIQRKICSSIAADVKAESRNEFDPEHFNFRGVNYPMIDVWGMACQYLLNTDAYKHYCLENGYISNSGSYFSTNAENAMRYLSKNNDFIESHTALDDAEIETEILFKALKKGKIIQGIVYFPFRLLGDVEEFVMENNKITLQMAQMAYDKIREYAYKNDPDFNRCQIAALNKVCRLMDYINENWD